ncbi:murein hydrolase activator EnvC family protein [Oceanobacillus chungangensis]|uniref:Uncharacterized protein n=1 Tax=Oceanobacillus chungangensis TaxID=1229152 RepID=A0A3D8PKB0_9BACI|nr:peptidoglycan DD-metalloendopeptidase family protein [Oceanobacillus chungangensis]RDW15679.1 hypothetical protein CWR45_18070 [Oceanobacillus chungangensis]
MKKVFKYVLVAGLVLTVSSANVPYLSAETIDDLDKEINNLEREKQELESKKNNIENDKTNNDSKIQDNLSKQTTVEQEISNIDEQLTKTNNDIYEKENEIKETDKEIKDLNSRIEKLKEEIIVLEQRIEERNVLLKDRLRTIQQNGGEMQYIEVLFGAQSFGDFISRSSAVNTIMDQDKTIMEEQAADKKTLEENKVEVEVKKVAVEDKKKLIEGQKQELVALKGQLDGQMDEKATLMAQLEEEHGQLEEIKLTLEDEQEILRAEEISKAQAIALAQNKKGELEQAAREEAARVAAEKAAAEQEAAERAASERASSDKSTNKIASANPTPPKQSNQSSNVSSGGIFIYPASGPITSSFGPRIHPIYGGQGSHNGIDFGVASGTTLVAPADGVVSTARYMNSFGNVIMISHHIDGKTYTTVMAHLSRISVSPGQTVSQGEAIGATGNTGDSTGPHLHFEVHIGGYGNPVNPLSYLR